MRHWSETAARIAATTRTSEKVATLAEYLRSLAADELPLAVRYMAGRPFAENDPRTTGIGWAGIAGVAERLVDAQPGALSTAYNESSDLGRAVHDLFAQHGHEPPPEGQPTLPEVAEAFAQMAEARGAAAKAVPLAALLSRCDPSVARSVIKILSGDMRIGLREGHLEAAIAAAFDAQLADVQMAGMLTGDLGHTAELARDQRLDAAELTMFRPLKSMLAYPVADEAEVLRRLGAPVWVEDKYDGIRAQLHKQGREVRIFSRDLNEVSKGYPEVVAAAAGLAWDGILDGELLAFRDGMALPFIQLQARLGRKNPSRELQEQTPVIYVAFDALALGTGEGTGKSQRVEPLLRAPLAERRARLDALNLPATPGMATSNLLNASTPDELATIFDAAQERGNEGLMVKDPEFELHARPPRLRLAEAQASFGDAGLRGGGRRGRSRQAPRRSERLHLRRARRPTRRRRPAGDDRQGVQRSDRQGDRRHDGILPRAHHPSGRAFPRRRAGGRRRDRVRRDPPQPAPRFRLRAALSAHLSPAAGQGCV